MPIQMFSQTINELWKQYEEAVSKDLPKTQISVLDKIIDKSRTSHQYGHLLKAELKRVVAVTSVTPDSLQSEVNRLVNEAKTFEGKDPVLFAVYNSVLGTVYRQNSFLTKDSDEEKVDFFKKSMEQPELLAAQKAESYVPLLHKGIDSKWFDNDLLHVIGFQAEDIKTMYEYYKAHGNRNAACLLACLMVEKDARTLGAKKSILRVDSLLEEYGDTEVAGELAVSRYSFMNDLKSFTVEDKINYIDYALKRWGTWKRTNMLRNARTQMTTPAWLLDFGSKVLLPNKPHKVEFRGVRNCESLTVTINRVDIDIQTVYNVDREKELNEVKKHIVKDTKIELSKSFPGKRDFDLTNDSLEIPALAPGAYLGQITTSHEEKMTRYFLFYVSDVYVLSQELPGKKLRLAVVSATTGKPLPNAKVKIDFAPFYQSKKNMVVNTTCDGNGETIITLKSNYSSRPNIYATTADDNFCPLQSLWIDDFSMSSGSNIRRINIYTDRAIYRPGQTVHAALLMSSLRDSYEAKALRGETVKLQLRDANHNVVEEKELVTDDFGKAYTDFQLPKSGLTGTFSLRVEDFWETEYFSVEEYKRPTFQVEIEDVTGHYADGDTVEVKGYAKTYAGVPVQGARVYYSVERHQSRWWWWFNNEEENDYEYEPEPTVTDGDGAFIMRVPVILPKNPDGDDAKYRVARFYNFIVNAKVTDQAGETHEGETYLPLGTKTTAFSCNVPKKELADKLKTIRFSLRNAAGVEIEGDVRYRIDGGKEYQTKANQDTPIGKTLASGEHMVTAICGTDTLEQKFLVFKLDDKKPCIETHDWFYATEREFPADGSPVRIQVGTTDPQTHVFYTVIAGNNVLESGTFQLDNANRNISLKYKKEYGTGVLLTYAWVREGVMYSHSHPISRTMPDKRLILKWTTFRDKLKPGQNEEWTLSVTRPDGKPANAQLMATLYDKSLDQITPHHFSYYSGISPLLPHTKWNGFVFSSISKYASKGFRSQDTPDLEYYTYDDNLFSFWGPRFYNDALSGGMRLRKSANVRYEEMALADMAAPMAVAEESADFDKNAADDEEKAEKPQDDDEQKRGGEEAQIRENLNETAFFKPAVVTDAKGNLSLRFTLPESITTWKLIGLATDMDLNYGTITAEAVAKKDVMIQPNVPRFVRVGDNAKISARIFNTSEKDIDGTATLTLIDPETDEEIYKANQKFSVKAGQTTSATFDYQPAGNGTVLICRMIASGDGFSDGEQHELPILPNRELVTRTLPITQQGPQVTTIDLDKLFPAGGTDGKLTVEYTNNPAWLMVQALPSMSKTDSENAFSLATSFYANSISSYLLNLSPNIKTTIQDWMKETAEENSMKSNLAKNEELKDLLLNETPWVGDANNEEAQKRDLINLFDENNLNSRLDRAISKLEELQQSSGLWPWYPGMMGSYYVTASVTETLVRLNSMIGEQEATKDMLSNSFRALGKFLVTEAELMKKDEKKGYKVRPSETAVDILYTFALDGRKQPQMVQEAQKYMVDKLAKKTAEFTIYGKAVTAVILAANGKKAKAEEYLKSIQEYSVYTEEMGRYYDTRKAYYSWFNYAIPTQVAAIEAIKRLNPQDTTTVEEMRRWLLQAKRTQDWDTPINSVNAVYAFLDGNVGTLDQQVQTILSVDGKAIDTSDATAGLGYVKTAMPSEGLKQFQADKKSQGTSWGALYAQFMQDVKEVENSSAGITVKREIFAPQATLHVGDKVKIRITIKADRDYDFVEVIDRRAACMEPVEQLSSYHYGCYIATKDYTTNYYFDMLGKGTHVVETEYYIDREGIYETGTCKVQCAYAPEFSATGKAIRVEVK
jgi:hypothetical protein